MTKRAVVGSVIGAVVAAGVLAATVVVAGGPGDGGPAADRQALMSNVEEPAPGTRYRTYANLREMLPNVTFTRAGSPDGPAVTDSVVLGRFVDVRAGVGFVESGMAPTKGRPGAREVGYDDAEAHWRTLRVDVAVDEVLAGQAGSTLTLSWSLKGNAESGEDADAISRALSGMGRVVVLTNAVPDGPEYLGLGRLLPDPAYSVATVSEDGQLDLPLVEDDHEMPAARFLGELDTLDELRAAAREPGRRKALQD